MKLSEKGIKFIKEKEGCRLKSYRCSSNILTIGYGHTGADVHSGMIITQDEANRLFEIDKTIHENNVNKLVMVQLTQGQFDALVSLEYNIGYGNFSKSSILRLVNQKKIKEAGERFLFKNPNAKTLEEKYRGCWVFNSLKKVELGLVKRREDEQKMFVG